MMNIGKAVKVALAKNEKSQLWLSQELGMSPQAINSMCARKSSQVSLIGEVADALDMRILDLIALGEK